MEHPWSEQPDKLGRFLGIIPLSSIIETDDITINLGALEVFEHRCVLRLIAVLREGMATPIVDLPDEQWQLMLRSHEAAILESESDDSHPAPDRRFPAMLDIRVRLRGENDQLMYGMPVGSGSDNVVWNLEYEFIGDLRSLENPVLAIEAPTWINHFSPTVEHHQEFEPSWSVPVLPATLIAAQLVDDHI